MGTIHFPSTFPPVSTSARTIYIHARAWVDESSGRVHEYMQSDSHQGREWSQILPCDGDLKNFVVLKVKLQAVRSIYR